MTVAETPPWPRDLSEWEPELRFFARELVGVLASMSARVASALGPLMASAELSCDEPDGYSALSRRGPYERLLVSEWALQVEHPDEFVRRASSGEHLFVELARRAPAAEREVWLLLDTGPSQLGAPRLGQLAVLVAFHRRVRERGLLLRWAPLSHWGTAPYEGLGPSAIEGWLSARTSQAPGAEALDGWGAWWDEEAPEVARDVWLIGGAAVSVLAAERGWSSIVVEDDLGEAPSLALEVRPRRRPRPSALRLPLPPRAAQVRLLRDPFGWAKAAPAPRKPEGAVRLHRATELAFSVDEHRLLARTEDGSAVALPVRNTARDALGRPKVARLPTGTRLFAVAWASRRDNGLLVLLDAEPVLRPADWNGWLRPSWPDQRAQATLPEPHELLIASTNGPRGWIRRGLWFSGEEPWDTRRRFAALSPRGLLGLAGDAGDAAVGGGVLDESPGWRRFRVAEAPDQAWLGGVRYAAVACRFEDRLEVYAERAEPEVRQTVVPIERLRDHQLEAISNAQGIPSLFAIADDRRTVRLMHLADERAPWTDVVMARAPIEALAVSLSGDRVAWRDASGQLAVFSRSREQVLLRVRVDDLEREVP